MEDLLPVLSYSKVIDHALARTIKGGEYMGITKGGAPSYE